MIDPNLYFQCDTEPGKGSGLKFRKEAIYVGTFFAPSPDGSRQKFSVTEDDLKHWKKSIDLQLSRGILVDVPIGHTTAPEASRGKVVGASVDINSRGQAALFLDIEFADEKAAQLAKTTQVSIYSPPSWTDGLGNTYDRPVRHVALTQQPVIPKLDAFTLIASLDEGTNSMEFLTQIAEAIGLEVAEDMDEAALTQAILDAITSSDEDPEMEDEELPAEDEELPLEDEDPMLDDEEEDDEQVMSLSMAREVALGRKARIGLLLSQAKITPAQAKALEKRFCVTGKGVLALSNDFDAAIDLMSLSEPRRTGSRTGAQLGKSTNVLLADAEARAKI